MIIAKIKEAFYFKKRQVLRTLHPVFCNKRYNNKKNVLLFTRNKQL